MQWASAAIVVWIVAALAFLPALRNGFVTWDDDRNFTDNPAFRGLGLHQLHWMWTTFHMGHYTPLSWMTLGADYLVWGMYPGGYHLTSIVIHAFDAVLLFYLARMLLARAFEVDEDDRAITLGAAFGALVFAVHPLRVESVAWATERRDVVSMFLCLCCVIVYTRYALGRVGRGGYWASVALFVAALLAKGTSIVVVPALLLIDIYTLRRTNDAKRIAAELLPFAILSVASVGLTLIALQHLPQLGLGDKLAVSAYGLAFYLWKTAWPTNLSPLYDMPKPVPTMSGEFIAAYLTLAAFAIVVGVMARRNRGLLIGALAFAALTFPMLGIVQNGPQLAADRYTYHSAPAIALLAAAAFAMAYRKRASISLAVGGALIVVMVAATMVQIAVWHDSRTLWNRVIALSPTSPTGNLALARLDVSEGKNEEALPYFRVALAQFRSFSEGHNDFGTALAKSGHLEEAAAEYRQALTLAPNNAEPHNNLGIVASRQGDFAAAAREFRAALQIEPRNAASHINLGNALLRLGRADEAVAEYSEAAEIDPRSVDAHLNWGVALVQSGRVADAIQHFNAALAIDPASPDGRRYLDGARQLLAARKP